MNWLGTEHEVSHLREHLARGPGDISCPTASDSVAVNSFIRKGFKFPEPFSPDKDRSLLRAPGPLSATPWKKGPSRASRVKKKACSSNTQNQRQCR